MGSTDMLVREASEADDIRLPTDERELAELQHHLGEVLREYDRTELELNQVIATTSLPYAQQLAEHKTRAEKIANMIFKYAEANRRLLTNNERNKTVKHAGGSFNWRKKLVVSYAKDMIDTMIAELKRHKLKKRFTRTKEELNRGAINKARELIMRKGIPGITYHDTETFSVQPTGARGMTRFVDKDEWEIEISEEEKAKKAANKKNGGSESVDEDDE